MRGPNARHHTGRATPETRSDDAWSHDARAVGVLYEALDQQRQSCRTELSTALRSSAGLTPQTRLDREATVRRLTRRLAQLEAAEERLVFGRLDRRGAEPIYIGRLGLRPGNGSGPVLVDWRAPAAAPFYQATPAHPDGLLRRRHLHVRARTLVGIDEEVLDPVAAAARPDREQPEGARASTIRSDPLTRALTAPRTGRMGDIVATLQTEQDRIVRSPGTGALLVHGAPGTGKTVVALHRAAYLLYSEPQRRRGGVLVVGPSSTFLRYISQVLPALGESDVVLTTATGLYAGMAEAAAGAHETTAAAALKKDLRMVELLRRAVCSRQRLLERPVPLQVDDATVWLRPETVAEARAAARADGEPHNQARSTFAGLVLDDLARQYLAVPGGDHVGGEEVPQDSEDLRGAARAALRASPDVRREVNLCWMPLRPEQVLGDLYAREDLLRLAAPGWTAFERALLHRGRSSSWTEEDVPLLDELAALLGPLPDRATQDRSAARREAVQFAADTLASHGGTGLVSAAELARRYGIDDDLVDARPLAQRAAEDPGWAFGHVVVDEAQDLSPMQWRMVLRRCPSRSMTIVGDLHQRTGPTAARADGSTSWQGVLGPHLRRWREERLTVNYRTPAEHLELAIEEMRARGCRPTPVTSIRRGGTIERVQLGDDRASALRALVARSLVETPGTVCLVAADPEDPDGPAGASGGGGVGDRFSAVTPGQAKGLEFDTVIVLDAERVVEQHGTGGLYVSLTRATHRLVLAQTPDRAGTWTTKGMVMTEPSATRNCAHSR